MAVCDKDNFEHHVHIGEGNYAYLLIQKYSIKWFFLLACMNISNNVYFYENFRIFTVNATLFGWALCSSINSIPMSLCPYILSQLCFIVFMLALWCLLSTSKHSFKFFTISKNWLSFNIIFKPLSYQHGTEISHHLKFPSSYIILWVLILPPGNPPFISLSHSFLYQNNDLQPLWIPSFSLIVIC